MIISYYSARDNSFLLSNQGTNYDMRNGNILINSKITQAKLMKFSPVIEHEVYFKNTKF